MRATFPSFKYADVKEQLKQIFCGSATEQLPAVKVERADTCGDGSSVKVLMFCVFNVVEDRGRGYGAEEDINDRTS